MKQIQLYSHQTLCLFPHKQTRHMHYKHCGGSGKCVCIFPKCVSICRTKQSITKVCVRKMFCIYYLLYMFFDMRKHISHTPGSPIEIPVSTRHTCHLFIINKIMVSVLGRTMATMITTMGQQILSLAEQIQGNTHHTTSSIYYVGRYIYIQYM